MEVIAITRNAKMSAFKGRPLARECQGLKAAEALKVVEFSPRKAAEILESVNNDSALAADCRALADEVAAADAG